MTEITIMYVLLRRGAEYPRHTDCLGIYSTPERAMQAGDVSVANAMEVVYGAAERAGTKPTVVLPQVWETLYHAGTAPGGRYARWYRLKWDGEEWLVYPYELDAPGLSTIKPGDPLESAIDRLAAIQAELLALPGSAGTPPDPVWLRCDINTACMNSAKS